MYQPHRAFRRGRGKPQSFGGRGGKWSSWTLTSEGPEVQPPADGSPGAPVTAGKARRNTPAPRTAASSKEGNGQWLRTQSRPAARTKPNAPLQSQHKKWVRPAGPPDTAGQQRSHGMEGATPPLLGLQSTGPGKSWAVNREQPLSARTLTCSTQQLVALHSKAEQAQPSVPYVKQRHNTLALQSAKQLPKPDLDDTALRRRQQSKGRVHDLSKSHRAISVKEAGAAKKGKHKVWRRSDSQGDTRSPRPVVQGVQSGIYKRNGSGNKLIRHGQASLGSKRPTGAQAARAAALELKLRAAAATKKLRMPQVTVNNIRTHKANRTHPKGQGTNRCTKLKRIGEHLYKVEVTGPGQTLTRQTSETLTTAAATANAKRVATAASAALTAQVKARVLAQVASARSSSKRRSHAIGASLPSLLKHTKRHRQPAKEGTIQRRPCPVYCRTGKCKKAKEGNCKMIHDPSKVAVCIPWLNGSCTNHKCKKQHKVCPELMPVCAYFLQGMCSKDNCPYLHVNLDPAAPICQAFSRGYCPKGKECPMKHFSQQQIDELRVKAGRPRKAVQAAKPCRNKTLIRKAPDAQGVGAHPAKRQRSNGTSGVGQNQGAWAGSAQESDGMLPADSLLRASSSLIPSFLKELEAEAQGERIQGEIVPE